MDWQREASVSFATHRTAEGLAAYREHGDIRLSETKDEARCEIVRDYLADRDERPDGTRVAMAHRRADVRAINDAIRSALQERGELAKGNVPGEGLDAGALTYQTNDGKREFAPGDRIVFLENNRDLGVKNGMLGTVESIEAGRIVAQLDGPGGKGRGDSISVPTNDYRAFDHGYATTIHKNQGATVDRAFVMASGTMDRHLTYVAMTRHRDGVQLYASADEFTDRRAGKLVEHGVAPYEHREGNRDSYFVTLENDKGQKHTVWGVDLERAMGAAQPSIGAKIGLEHRGSEAVRLPDGTTAERNAWKVHDAGELAYAQLENRLSRSGAKETTLDYARDFAERRGIAEQFGIRGDIEVPAERTGLRPDRERAADRQTPERGSSQTVGADLGQDPAADRGEHAQPVAGPRRGMFAGLKLSGGVTAEKPQQERAGESGQRIDRKEPEQTEKQPPKRSMFDGLKLTSGRGAGTAERPDRDGERLGQDRATRDRLAERVRPLSGFEQAVDRYAQAYSSAEQQLQQNLPVLETQKQAYRAAAADLDQARPGSHALIRSVMQYDPKTVEAMTQLSGRERVGQLVAGMDRERALQADPNVRADRFIERWNELRSERQQLRGWQHDEARGKVESQMQGMGKSLERDPQLESTLRNRSQELGIKHIGREQTVAREMERQVSQSRSRNMGMER